MKFKGKKLGGVNYIGFYYIDRFDRHNSYKKDLDYVEENLGMILNMCMKDSFHDNFNSKCRMTVVYREYIKEESEQEK
jgi:hypothetical protein